MVLFRKNTHPAPASPTSPLHVRGNGKPKARQPVVNPAEKPNPQIALRKRFIAQFKAMPEWNGRIQFDGSDVQVVKGAFIVEGVTYLVSKDGVAVMNTATRLLVGEVVGGVVGAPSDELKQRIRSIQAGG